MRNIILGTIAGLLVGTLGSLAYTEYFGDSGQLAGLQSQLDAANAKLAKAEADAKFLKEENNSETEQLNQVLASKQQPDRAVATPAAAPVANPLTIGGMQITPDMVRGFMGMMGRGNGPGGGFRSPEQRMFLLQSRLKLDPDQAKAIKAAMDADNAARRDAFRQARQNGVPPDPAALAAANTMDKTLTSVLSPSQQVQYQQLQTDEKQARAESAATAQIDNMMPLLQLSDDQKEKAMNALYQQQLTAPDPGSLATNPNPMGAMAQQGATIQNAMKQVLSPDQFTLYQQSEQVQAQGMANFGGNRRNNNGGGGNGNGGGQGQGQGQASGGGASGATPAAVTPSTASTDTTTPASTNAASATPPDSSSSTNTPSATTNAVPATPPPAN